MKKVCKSCNIEKEIDNFYFNKKYYDGKCKTCRNSFIKARKAPRIDEINKLRAISRNTPQGKILRRFQTLRYKYNITLEEFNTMYDNQKGLCNICNKPQDKSIAVDHDHKTNKVRGLLCSGCNAKLAWFESYKDKIFKHLGISL